MDIAAQHELIGDGPKALLPKCDLLADDAPKCIHVFDVDTPNLFPSNTILVKNYLINIINFFYLG